jgi:hypothetical protein
MKTWNPRSAIRRIRSVIGRSRKTISAQAASSIENGGPDVAGCS